MAKPLPREQELLNRSLTDLNCFYLRAFRFPAGGRDIRKAAKLPPAIQSLRAAQLFKSAHTSFSGVVSPKRHTHASGAAAAAGEFCTGDGVDADARLLQ